MATAFAEQPDPGVDRIMLVNGMLEAFAEYEPGVVLTKEYGTAAVLGGTVLGDGEVTAGLPMQLRLLQHLHAVSYEACVTLQILPLLVAGQDAGGSFCSTFNLRDPNGKAYPNDNASRLYGMFLSATITPEATVEAAEALRCPTEDAEGAISMANLLAVDPTLRKLMPGEPDGGVIAALKRALRWRFGTSSDQS